MRMVSSSSETREPVLPGLCLLLTGLIWIGLILGGCFPAAAQVSGSQLVAGLNHLFDLVSAQKRGHLDLHKIDPLLAFITHAPFEPPAEVSDVGDVDGAFGFYAFDVDIDFTRLLTYAFNSKLPHQLTAPNSARLGYFFDPQNPAFSLPDLTQCLPGLEKPKTCHFMEHVQITPDPFSGAYYEYDAYRTLILVPYADKTVLISVTKQKDVSEVGRKGLILGSDSQWNYLYTGIKGLTVSGLGWADTYMYDAFSVALYVASPNNPSPVTCAVFKWIKAGWQNINAVKSRHIIQGLERFAKGFKRVLENPRLPDAGRLEADIALINALPEAGLRKRMELYLDRLVRRYEADKRLQEKPYAELLTQKTLQRQMSTDEMRAVLVLEYVKETIGMAPLIRFAETSAEPRCFASMGPGARSESGPAVTNN